jgi:hypothetical protein
MRRAAVVSIVFIFGAALLVAAAPVTSAAACSWSAVTAPNPGSVQTLLAAVDGAVDDVWTVGAFKDPGTLFKSLAEHMTPDGWKRVKTPNVRRRNNILSNLTYLTEAEVWAVGNVQRKSGEAKNLMQHWDGTTWSRVPVPASGRAIDSLSGIDAAPPSDLPIDPIGGTDLWAVGTSAKLSGASRAQILHYDGTTWTSQAGPAVGSAHGLAAVLAISPTDVWAVGYKKAGDEFRPLAMHFDGAIWSVIQTPGPGAGFGGSSLSGLAGSSSTDLWAAGTRGDGQPFVMHYDGTTWTVESGFPEVTGEEAFISITQHEDGDLWAAGLNITESKVRPLLMHRAGETWSNDTTPSPSVFNVLIGVTAVPGGAVWAAGYSVDIEGNAKSFLLRCG